MRAPQGHSSSPSPNLEMRTLRHTLGSWPGSQSVNQSLDPSRHSKSVLLPTARAEGAARHTGHVDSAAQAPRPQLSQPRGAHAAQTHDGRASPQASGEPGRPTPPVRGPRQEQPGSQRRQALTLSHRSEPSVFSRDCSSATSLVKALCSVSRLFLPLLSVDTSRDCLYLLTVSSK